MRPEEPRSVAALGAALRTRATTSLALIDRALSEAARWSALNAFVTLDPEGARRVAKERDVELTAGHDRGPLHGVPIAIKDNICVAGLPTTCGSALLRDWVAPVDATVVSRLRAAGAVIVGKTNLDAFAMGSSSENSAFGAVGNPLDPTCVPGGSSGGSAAAVAAGIVSVALGSDTGGSVRQPAAFCGVTGFRPTWGTVSRSGLVAFASSLDQVGPIAIDVASAAVVLEAIAGVDPRDATCRVPLLDGAPSARMGVVAELRQGLPEDGEAALHKAIELWGGATEVSIPHVRFAGPAYYVIASAEASSNLARFDAVRFGARCREEDDGILEMIRRSRSEGLGAEVRRRILLGTFVLSHGHREQTYALAQRARLQLRAEFDAAFARCDLLLSLTAPERAFKRGAKSDPVTMYQSDLLTIPAALAGIPAVSIPAPGRGLPFGVQIMGPPGADRAVLAAAAWFEAAWRSES